MPYPSSRRFSRFDRAATVLAGLTALLPGAALAQSEPHGPGGGYPQGGGNPQGGRFPQGGGHPQGGGGFPHGGFGRGWGYRGFGHVAVIDRGRPGWWRGRPAFVGYAGVRPGYYFAPGYGYYAVPPGYARTTWAVGATLPPPMRRYVVVEPAVYGLRPPPLGFGWYYAGTNFVLVAAASGAIVQSIAGGW